MKKTNFEDKVDLTKYIYVLFDADKKKYFRDYFFYDDKGELHQYYKYRYTHHSTLKDVNYFGSLKAAKSYLKRYSHTFKLDGFTNIEIHKVKVMYTDLDLIKE